MTFLWLAIPALIYAVISCIAARSGTEARPSGLGSSSVPAFLALMTAACSGWVVSQLAADAPTWPGGAQLAWTGVASTAPEGDLALGHVPAKGSLGWPRGAFSPSVHFLPVGGAIVADITGGRGFVRLETPNGNTYLNGERVPFNRRVEIDGLFLELDRPILVADSLSEIELNPLRKRVHVRVFDASGVEIAHESDLHVPDKDRVVSLEGVLASSVNELRASRDRAAEITARRLETWARDQRLLLEADGDVLILGEGAQPVSRVLGAECTLRVMWPGLSIPLTARIEAERIHLTFVPPWRVASPLYVPETGPVGEPQTVDFVLTEHPLPGDHAFVLPFRGFSQSVRKHFSVTFPENGRPTVAGVGSDIGKPPIPDTKPPLAPLRETRASGLSFRESSGHVDVELSPAFPATVRLETVSDLPQPRRLLGGVAIAFVLFALGLWLALPLLRPVDAWTVGGILSAAWTLLCLRLLLAFRYALEPTHLDGLVVKGVGGALLALTLVPGLMLLAVRLQRNELRMPGETETDRTRSFLVLLGYLLLLAAGFLMNRDVAPTLWANLPTDLQYQPGTVSTGLLALLGVYLFVLLFFRYLAPSAYLPRLHQAWLVPLVFMERAVRKVGPRIWQHVHAPHVGAAGDKAGFAWPMLVLTVTGVLCVWAMTASLSTFGGGSKLVQEVVFPVLCCLLPASLWVASLQACPPGSRVLGLDWSELLRLGPAWRRLVALALAMLAVPVFLLPLVQRDAGSILANLAIFVPLPLLLVLADERRIGFVALGAIGMAFLAALVVYVNLYAFLPLLPGQSSARLLAFKEGPAFQTSIPFATVSREKGAVTYRNLRNAIQHGWENTAISHEGGLTGLGFGNAPVRRSEVPQQVVQYDSTFSFFILSEHGLLGGLALLSVYLMPVVLVLLGGRARLDTGHGLAWLVAMAFFLEASFHAAMNLNLLPFTGRNLPLLSVNSPSDLLRWTILWVLALQAIQWRSTTLSTGYRRSAHSILTLPAVGWEPSFRYLRAGALLLAIPVTCFALIASVGWKVQSDPKHGETFSWSGLLDTVQWLADNDLLSADPSTLRLELAPHVEPDGWMMIEQEIARFNSLSKLERLEGMSPARMPNFGARLEQVRNLNEYDELLGELAAAAPTRPLRPQLFALEPPLRWANVEETIPTLHPKVRIRPNLAFNNTLSFRAEHRHEDHPAIHFPRPGQAAHRIVGNGFDIGISRPGAGPPGLSRVRLDAGTDGRITRSGAETAAAERTTVSLSVRPRNEASRVSSTWGQFRSVQDGVEFGNSSFHLTVWRAPDNTREDLAPRNHTTLRVGDRVETRDLLDSGVGLRPWFELREPEQKPHVGPAWVMGHWMLAFDPDPLLPWTRHLAKAIAAEGRRLGGEETSQLYEELTLDRGLHASAQHFVRKKGRGLHAVLLAGGASQLAPRVALTVLDAANGEVLALGGWPRMSSSRSWWELGNELVPPADWLEHEAPRSFRNRHAGDRNFDRMVLGSTTKPLWAAVGLAIHPEIAELAVSGTAGRESEAFGMRMASAESAWKVGASRSLSGGSCCDFRSYLATSDNRYQVRLGLLALAVRDPNGIATQPGSTGSPCESFDRCRTSWDQYPQFPDSIGITPYAAMSVQDLHRSPAAELLRDMFGASVERGDKRYKTSFWTGREADDREDRAVDSGPTALFRGISPQAPDLALDWEVDSTRRYVSLLLGGGTNLWANADFAAAFVSCVTGRPCVSHVLRGKQAVEPDPDRVEFLEQAELIRPGLEAVVQPGGTAHDALGPEARSFLHGLRGVRVYAKTGTLAPQGESLETSRFVMAVIRWDPAGGVDRGLVFSLVAEQANEATATRWLGEYLRENATAIRSHFP